MSDTGNIPQAMIDAAARALHFEHNVTEAGYLLGSPWHAETEESRDEYRASAAAILAAAFAECEVREEWRAVIHYGRLDHAPTYTTWFADRTNAEAYLDLWRRGGHRDAGDHGEMERRLAILTPADDVPVVVTPAQEGQE